MSDALGPCFVTGAIGIIVGASLIAIPSLPQPGPNGQARAVQLTDLDGSDSADSPLGAGTALMMGATSFPTPSQGWMNAFDALYLVPRGFTGTMPTPASRR